MLLRTRGSRFYLYVENRNQNTCFGEREKRKKDENRGVTSGSGPGLLRTGPGLGCWSEWSFGSSCSCLMKSS
jgi:hypothetical protein